MLIARYSNVILEQPSLLQFAQTRLGKLTLIGLMTLALIIYHQLGLTWWPIIALPGQYHGVLRWPFVTAAITATTFLPQYRRMIVALMGIIGLTTLPWFQWEALPQQTANHGLIVASVFLAIGLLMLAVKQFKIQKPVLLLLGLIFTLILIASYTHAIYLWSSFIVLSAVLWFVCYSMQIKSFKHIFFYLPFWGSTTTPLPKGNQYLAHIEAKDAVALAKSQLEGIKLIYWSLCMAACIGLLYKAYLYFDIPKLSEAFARLHTNHPCPWYQAWVVVLEQFGFELFAIAMYSHLVIGLCRMSGFNAQRNMDSPLTATTIADFWNRYYFYFKELLVEFFFYPTYFRYFKKHPRLRIFCATMMAACVGNIIFHLLAEPKYLIQFGFWGALTHLQVYVFYAFILGTAISVSQMRKLKKKTPKHPLQRYVLAPMTVIGFYCMMTVFNRPYQSFDLKQNLLFLASMFHL